jgi:hypothetical protein
VGILLAMQGDAQRDQPAGIAPGILIVIGHFGKVPGHNRPHVCADPARASRSPAEAMELEVSLRLAD